MLRISFNKVHRYTITIAAVSLCMLLGAVIGIYALNQDKQHAQALSLPEVQSIAPINNSYHQSSVLLSSSVTGASTDQYEMFWAVGNGEWNRMQTNATTGVSTTTIDISSWNWSSDNIYTIRFIAMLKDGWRPIEQAIVIHKGVAPTPQPDSTPQQITSTPAITPMIKEVSTGLYADPQATPAVQLRSNPANPALQYIAKQPTAQWYGGWNINVAADINTYISRATAAALTPVVVLYNIPQRDCGGHSAGGAADHAAYLDWVQQVANGINGRKVTVIVEPDALAAMDCLTSTDRRQRTATLSRAIDIIKTPQSRVYIDAGHSAWHSATTIADRLRAVGISKADGFSLNIANFRTTAESTAYGTAVSAKIGDKHFVIDTSRNGKGPANDGEWCNPAGRGLGDTPTASTGKSLVDAYLWIKIPGDSDGACGNGAPAAGQWWQSYADILYANRKK